MFFYEYFPKYEEYDAKAYLLKNLSAPELIAGQVVDWAINGALEHFIENGVMPEDLPTRGAEAFKRVVGASKNLVARIRAGNKPPRQSQPLHSDYYGYELKKGQVEQCEQTVIDCLYNFEVSEVLAHLLHAKPDRWGKIKQPTDYPPHFNLGDIVVYANYDIYFEIDGSLHIIDWKTARPTEQNIAKARHQLSVYALYGHEQLKFPVERIYVQAVWLQHISRWNPTIVTQEAVDDARRLIQQESSDQYKLINQREDQYGDPEYCASEDDFLPNPEVTRCFFCKYRELCPAGQAAVAELLSKERVAGNVDPFEDE